MTESLEVKVPNLGDFADVEIIEVFVKPGDELQVDDPLITLETEKAAMDVPSPRTGKVAEVRVSVGDRVSEGSVILLLEAAGEPDEAAPEPAQTAEERQPAAPPESPSETRPPAEAAKVEAVSATRYEGASDIETELLVLGAGPGGYAAAFRAADLGMQVVLVERWSSLGGVCLNVGCIPSKALLHAAKVIEEAESMAPHGIGFDAPDINPDKLRAWKDAIVGRLTGGLASLAKQRKVRVVHGTGKFVSDHHLTVSNGDSSQVIRFEQCIIAAGSESAMIPGLPDDRRVMDSSEALELDELPERLLVVGGGIIGLEMATVYDALGCKVSVVELTDTLMPGCDTDLVRPLQKRISKRYEQILLGTKVAGIQAQEAGLRVGFEGKSAPEEQVFGRVLVAVGRKPNGNAIDADKAGVRVDQHGFVPVDRQMRTNVPHIFAIGDIAGPPMLAHKATHEGKVAAEVASGMKRAFDARVIPSVAYTDPEVAWVGLTETDAKAEGIEYEKGQFPWMASGRSLAINRDDGFTKLLFDPATHRVLGAGIVGPNAGDLISEAALAIEMGCEAEDIGLTIHPHPTLSETVAFAAEAFDGTLTDLYMPKKKGVGR